MLFYFYAASGHPLPYPQKQVFSKGATNWDFIRGQAKCETPSYEWYLAPNLCKSRIHTQTQFTPNHRHPHCHPQPHIRIAGAICLTFAIVAQKTMFAIGNSQTPMFVQVAAVIIATAASVPLVAAYGVNGAAAAATMQNALAALGMLGAVAREPVRLFFFGGGKLANFKNREVLLERSGINLGRLGPARSGFPGRSQNPSKNPPGTLPDTLNPNPPKTFQKGSQTGGSPFLVGGRRAPTLFGGFGLRVSGRIPGGFLGSPWETRSGGAETL